MSKLFLHILIKWGGGHYMQDLFEFQDSLNSPIEALLFDAEHYPFPVQAHWHYFVEIAYIVEGVAKVILNSKTVLLHPGQMVFFFPQQIHSFNNVNDEPLRFYVLKFDLSKLPHPDNYISEFNAMVLSAANNPDLPIVFSQKHFTDFSLARFFRDCVQEINDKDFGYTSLLQYNISTLLLRIIRIWKAYGFDTNITTPVVKESYSINNILEYIDKHSNEKILVEDIAKLCHMSYSYFAKYFRDLYGQSCKDYIEFIRLSKVENLLLFTDYDLSYISNETGFSDCSHLIRVFKRKYGMTPKKFRMEHQKTNATKK